MEAFHYTTVKDQATPVLTARLSKGLVGIGRFKPQEIEGELTVGVGFGELHEAREIGTLVDPKEEAVTVMALTFTNVESIDVVIEALEAAKEHLKS